MPTRCPTSCTCRGTGTVTRIATESRGGVLVRSWTYTAECPAKARREGADHGRRP